MSYLRCSKCGNRLQFTIEFGNVTGDAISTVTKENKVKIHIKRLNFHDVNIKLSDLHCFTCKRDIKLNDLQLCCAYSHTYDTVNNFKILKLKRGGVTFRINYYHKDHVDRVRKEYEADGYGVEIYDMSVELQEELKL